MGRSARSLLQFLLSLLPSLLPPLPSLFSTPSPPSMFLGRTFLLLDLNDKHENVNNNPPKSSAFKITSFFIILRSSGLLIFA